MKWFKHDSNAHRDTKLRKVVMRYKAEGYALYWYCIELIASRLDKDNITFELEDDAEIIAYDIGIDSAKVQEIMRYMVELDLFKLNAETNRIVCMKLANRLDESASKNPQIRKVINAARETGVIGAKNKGYVYLMQSGEIFKIGMTTNLHSRLADFRNTNPNAVLLHTIESVDPHLLESTLHKYFKDLKREGEWFELAESDVNKIRNIREGDRFIREGFRNDSGECKRSSSPDQIRLDQIRLDNTTTSPPKGGGGSNGKKRLFIPYTQIVEIYHETLPNLPKLKILTDKRKAAIKKLFCYHEDHSSIDWWKSYFDYIANSDFLTNQTASESNPNWKCDLEWLTNINNFAKVVEGKYHA